MERQETTKVTKLAIAKEHFPCYGPELRWRSDRQMSMILIFLLSAACNWSWLELSTKGFWGTRPPTMRNLSTALQDVRCRLNTLTEVSHTAAAVDAAVILMLLGLTMKPVSVLTSNLLLLILGIFCSPASTTDRRQSTYRGLYTRHVNNIFKVPVWSITIPILQEKSHCFLADHTCNRLRLWYRVSSVTFCTVSKRYVLAKTVRRS